MKVKRYLLYILPMFLLFLLILPLQGRINRMRVEEDLVETDIFEATTPSDVWGTMLLAGFRGIAVDILWVRAMNLQDEGKFFELLPLHKLILDLQPHFINVWAFSAWNMAYNISHEMETVEEKWKWIQKGIAIIKKGVKRNPKSSPLLFQTGWIYFHKCEAEPYYKEQLKKEGKNNYKLALYWFKKSVEVGPHPPYIENMIAHAWEKLAKEAEQEGDLEKRDEYRKEAFRQWEENTRKYPEDNVSRDAYNSWKKILEEE